MKYPVGYNKEAIRTLVRRAMAMGFYEGRKPRPVLLRRLRPPGVEYGRVPQMRQQNLTKIDRMNGYLSYSRVKGDTRLNEAKMAEIAERKSM